MHGRDYVLPDDVKEFVEPALIHRLILEPDLWMKRFAAEDVLASIVQTVSVPVILGTGS
jgi:MoxR-like ATPase